MFKQTAIKQCLVLLLALAGVACSSTDSRAKNSNRIMLPASPIPQARMQAPPNAHKNGYGEYAHEKDYRDSYTSSIEREPPAVVEVLKNEPLEVQELDVQPLETIVERDGSSKVEREDLAKNELDIDPFADVPDREVLSANRQGSAAPPPPRSTQAMPRAAKVLLLAAKAESAVGRNDAAIDKIERALRIAPQSPELWYQLANFNFKKGRYDQAIGFARKALPMASGRRDLVNQNLDLMSKAAVKTGNTRVFKEVLDYKKQNF